MLKNSVRLFMFVAFFLLCAIPASAGMLTLDQLQEQIDGGSRVYSTRDLCQTFTAGMSGYLEKVSMSFSSLSDEQAPAVLSIIGTTGENHYPDTSNVLWTISYSNLAQGWFDVDLSASPPQLSAGTVYGIMLTSTDSVYGNPDDVWDTKFSSNAYVGGSLLENRGSGWQPMSASGTSYPDSDAAFRTYMSPVPEPSCFVIFIGALIIFLAKRKISQA